MNLQMWDKLKRIVEKRHAFSFQHTVFTAGFKTAMDSILVSMSEMEAELELESEPPKQPHANLAEVSNKLAQPDRVVMLSKVREIVREELRAARIRNPDIANAGLLSIRIVPNGDK